MKYPRIIGWSIVITMWALMGCAMTEMKNSAIHHTDECSDCQEVCNTVKDMIEWVGHDVESGKLDSTIADTYIDNLEGIIIDLGVTR
jgi:hypothetical protein